MTQKTPQQPDHSATTQKGQPQSQDNIAQSPDDLVDTGKPSSTDKSPESRKS